MYRLFLFLFLTSCTTGLGKVDSGVDCDGPWFADVDGDGFGDPDTEAACPAEGLIADGTDCNDGKKTVHPDAPEICDGLDNDCDGKVDDDDDNIDPASAQTYYPDDDGDGHGSANGSTLACSRPPNHETTATDCDDSDSTVNPDVVMYADSDGDGYGDATAFANACDAPSTYVTDNTDCNDSDNTINPGESESCDNVDNDCNNLVDDNVVTRTYYRDNDNDGYGTSSNTLTDCSAPNGYSSTSGDCNDGNIAINPGATEVCDNVDNNCDTRIDDDDPNLDLGTASPWYEDLDGDGFGSTTVVYACDQPSGTSTLATDCDDADSGAYPGNSLGDPGDGIDNDCDGQTDEGPCNEELCETNDRNVTAAYLAPGEAVNAAMCGEDRAGSDWWQLGTYNNGETIDLDIVVGTGITGTFHMEVYDSAAFQGNSSIQSGSHSYSLTVDHTDTYWVWVYPNSNPGAAGIFYTLTHGTTATTIANCPI